MVLDEHERGAVDDGYDLGGQFAKFPLNYAISVMESEFVAETLGEQVVEFFLGNKARSGRSTGGTSRSSSWTATWASSDRRRAAQGAGPWKAVTSRWLARDQVTDRVEVGLGAADVVWPGFDNGRGPPGPGGDHRVPVAHESAEQDVLSGA